MPERALAARSNPGPPAAGGGSKGCSLGPTARRGPRSRSSRRPARRLSRGSVLCPAPALSPRPRGTAQATAGSPLIVRGGGGGGGCAPEPRQDVAEAVVAVQLGLALGALDGALEATAEEALRAGRQEGEGEAGLARRRRAGTRTLAAHGGPGSAPAARGPRRRSPARPPTERRRPGPRSAAQPTPRRPPAGPARHVAPAPKPPLPWRRRAECLRPWPRMPEPPYPAPWCRKGGGGVRGTGLRRGGGPGGLAPPAAPRLPAFLHNQATPPISGRNPHPAPSGTDRSGCTEGN